MMTSNGYHRLAFKYKDVEYKSCRATDAIRRIAWAMAHSRRKDGKVDTLYSLIDMKDWPKL